MTECNEAATPARKLPVSLVAQAFLRWLYDHDREQPVPDRFLTDPQSWIEGHQVSQLELAEAVELLDAKRLVTGSKGWGGSIPLRIRLTDAGRISVVEQGVDPTGMAHVRTTDAGGRTDTAPDRSSPGPEQAPTVRNDLSGDVSGVVIQAGSVGSVSLPGSGVSAPIQVGAGADPQTQRAFEDAFRRAGGEGRLGQPTHQVIEDGLGYVQHFGGTAGGAVICARTGQTAVAVAGPVWDDLLTVPGLPAPGVGAAGYPVARLDSSSSGLIDYVPADATTVELEGGSLGPGVLVRSVDVGTARWQPHPRLIMEAREAYQMPALGQADLTVRAIAKLHWQYDDGELEITRRTREQLEALLPGTEISDVISVLSQARGGHVVAPGWIRASGLGVRQSGTAAQYESVLRAPDGTNAVWTTVRLFLPIGQAQTIRVFVEFQANLEGWRSALRQGSVGAVVGDLRITANEIVQLWTAAWNTATEVVRALVADPVQVPLLSSPGIELHVRVNESVDHRPGAIRELPLLVNMFDISVFGDSSDEWSAEGAATVVATLDLDRDERRKWAVKVLTRLARAWSFVDADESDLD